MSLLPYKVVQGSNNAPMIEVRGRKYSPSEMGAFILMKMKETAGIVVSYRLETYLRFRILFEPTSYRGCDHSTCVFQ
jgi:hypothetical protein